MISATESDREALALTGKPSKRLGHKIDKSGNQVATCVNCDERITQFPLANPEDGSEPYVWIHNLSSMAACRPFGVIRS